MVRAFNEFDKEIKRQLERLQNPVDGQLLSAAFTGDTDGIRMALENGAWIRAKDENGTQALHFAASSNTPEAVKVLLNAGADPNARDRFGNTPLHNAAVYAKTTDVAKLLIDAGARLMVRNEHGKTPLDDAVTHSNTHVVQMLEEAIQKQGKGFTDRIRRDAGLPNHH